MEIKQITQKETFKIIDTREPVGLFYEVDGDWHIGIDNSTGDALMEEFKTKEECFKWLNREDEPEDLIDEKQLYMAALTKWGPGLQISMVFEEMAELQKELCKGLRGKRVIGNIAEEIADVEIMLGQMKVLFDIEELVKENKQYKLERLSEKVRDIIVQVCRVCGCTQFRACEGGCYWVEEDLCSKCVESIKE